MVVTCKQILKPLLHPTRIQILKLLSEEVMSFSMLKNFLDLTEGSLGSNMKLLVQKGLVKQEKVIIDDNPMTIYSITNKGNQRLNYIKSWLLDIIIGE